MNYLDLDLEAILLLFEKDKQEEIYFCIKLLDKNDKISQKKKRNCLPCMSLIWLSIFSFHL